MSSIGRPAAGVSMVRLLAGAALLAALGGWLLAGGAEQTIRSIIAPARVAELQDEAKSQQRSGDRHAARETRRELAELRQAPSGPTAAVESLGSTIGRALLDAAKVASLVGIVLGGPLLAARTAARRRRRYRRFWLRPSMTEVVDGLRTARMWEAWHQQQGYRWWERAWYGQPSFAVETSAVPTASGGSEIRVGVVIADGPRLDAFIGRIRGAWQHVHVEEDSSDGPPWVEHTIRLKKRSRFSPRALAIVAPGADRDEGVGEHIVDDLRALSAELRRPFTVQLALVPAPGLYERRARRWFADGAESGPADPIAHSERQGASRAVAWRGLFFCDLRVCARERRVAEQVAATLQGGLRAQNVLRPRWMIARRRLYAARVRQGIANPIPSWRKGVFSTAECAALWALPTPFREAGETRAEIEPRLEPSSRVPRVSRERALLETQRGEFVRIAEDSLQRGLALVGAPGMGKTATLLQWFVPLVSGEVRTAGVMFDAKGDAAEAAIEAIPKDVKVHYCHFARPEIGFNPMAGSRSLSESAEAVTGAMIEATRTDQGESTILSSSKRFIHQVVMATRWAYDPPTFWHAWHLCSASQEADEARLELARRFGQEREMAGVAIAFQELSVQLRGARSAMIQRLDAPANKFYMLTDPQVDAILRHPHQVDIDRVIANGEVLVVNGAMGELGIEYTSMLMLMLLAMVHRSILRQQGLPEERRTRVAVGIDEAHLFFSPTLNQMLSMDRSAGLMAALAWHFNEQIADRSQRAGALALLRNRLFFALEQRDARELSDLLQPVHTDSLRARQEDREVVRVGPEVLARLPRFRVAADHDQDGRQEPTYIGKTLAISGSPEFAEHHLERQRREGGGPVSDEELALPPGLTSHPDAGRRVSKAGEAGRAGGPEAERGRSTNTAATGGGASRDGEDRDGDRPEAPPGAGARGGDDGAREAGERSGAEQRPPTPVARPDTSTSVPVAASYLELARYEHPTGVPRREVGRAANPVPRSHRPPAGETEGERAARLKGLWVLDETGVQPNADELWILAHLRRLRFLTQPQIAEYVLPNASARTLQRRLKRLYDAGWVSRTTLRTGMSRDPLIYAITRAGFEMTRLKQTPKGTVTDPAKRWPLDERRAPAELARVAEGEAKWRESEKQNLIHIVHDLGVAEWVLRVTHDLAANCVLDWSGESELRPPGREERDSKRWLVTPIEELSRPAAAEYFAGLDERPRTLRPDAVLECEIETAGEVRPFDVFVEYQRRLKPNDGFTRKLRAYDALLTAWGRQVPRYREWRSPGVVIVVCPNAESAERHARRADQTMSGAVVEAGGGTRGMRWPGRAGVFFCSERDVHQRTMRAFALEKLPVEGGRRDERPGVGMLPPDQRARLARGATAQRQARQARLRVVEVLPRRALTRPAGPAPNGV